MKPILKQILRAIGGQKEPAFTEARFKSFFNDPVWLALRQSVARHLDNVLDSQVDAKTLEDMWKFRGVVIGLQFLMEPESMLAQYVTDNPEELSASAATEQRLKQLLQLWEKEYELDKS